MLEPQVQSRREIKQLPSKIRGESKRFSRLGLTSYGRLRRLVNVSLQRTFTLHPSHHCLQSEPLGLGEGWQRASEEAWGGCKARADLVSASHSLRQEEKD